MADELEIGEVLGVHGVKGALRVRLHDAGSTALEVGREVHLVRGDTTLLRSEIARVSAKPGTSQVRLWLVELGTREGADSLRGAKVCMARDELGPLPDDEFYLADLVGLTLRMRCAPQVSLGEIVGVMDNRMQDLLEIEWVSDQGKTTKWLLPAVGPYLEEILDEDLWIDPPEGLLPAALERLVKASSAEPSGDQGA